MTKPKPDVNCLTYTRQWSTRVLNRNSQESCSSTRKTHAPNKSRKGVCDLACNPLSLYDTCAHSLYLIRAISTRILLVAKTAGGITFSLATFCLAVSNLPQRAVCEESHSLIKRLQIDVINMRGNVTASLIFPLTYKKIYDLLIHLNIFKSTSRTSIQNIFVILRAAQARCSNIG